jgi:Zn-dependent peptidase ImmA (M78 family)/DNA-binding XRE family transcriptional regulator
MERLSVETDLGKSLGQRIRRLRKNLGLSQKDLASQMGFGSSETISQIERAQREVKAWELAKLAKLLFVELSELLLTEEPAPLPSVLWRVVPKTQRKIKEAEFLSRCQQYTTLEALSEAVSARKFPSKRVDPHHINSVHARRLAEEVRRDFGLGDRPAAALEKILQDRYGVKVWYDELNEGSAAATVGSFGPAILMNSKEAPWRRNYNFAHEVFHLITWYSVPPELLAEDRFLLEKIEKTADVFASCLLLPGDAVRIEFEEHITDGKIGFSDLVGIARNFDVSTEALLYRLLNLRLVSQDTVQSLLTNEMFRNIDRSTMAACWWTPPKFPERFVRLAFLAYQKGNLSRAKLAQLLDTSLLHLTDVLQEYALDDRESYNAKICAA